MSLGCRLPSSRIITARRYYVGLGKTTEEPTEHDNILTNLLIILSLKHFELARSSLDYKYDSKGPTSIAEKTPTAACIFSSDVTDSDRIAHIWSC